MPPKKQAQKRTKAKVYTEDDESFDTAPVVEITVNRGQVSPSKGKKSPHTESDSPHKPVHSKSGLEKNRKCRDVPWLILFLVFWVGMAVVAYSAILNGDPRKIIVPMDYLGNFCGLSNANSTSNSTVNAYADQSARPYLYYFDPVLLTKASYICVAECPTLTAATVTIGTSICRYDQVPTSGNLASLIASGLCTSYTYKSSPVIGRCLMTADIPASVSQSNNTNLATMSASEILSAGSNTIVSSISDITVGWPVLVGAAAITVVLCFIWLLMLQVIASFMVWLTVALVNLIMIVGSAWLYFYWQAVLLKLNNSLNGTSTVAVGIIGYINAYSGIDSVNNSLLSQQEVDSIGIGFYVMASIAGLLLLVTIAMLRRIATAIQIIKVASKACLRMPLIIFFPLIIWIGIAGLFVYFVWIGLYIITPVTDWHITIFGMTWNHPQLQTIVSYYHIFGFLWALWFLNAYNQVTIAGAIATWYWTMDKTEKLDRPLIRSASRTCRYHLGSIAIGSLLIAIVEFIRILLYQVARQASRSKIPALKYIIACLQCFLKCISMLLKFVNKNAYIYIAITGKGFFQSAGAAASLLLRNAAKTVALDFVADFILLISKLIVAALAGYGAYVYLLYGGSTLGTIRNPYVIAITSGLAGFIVITL